MKRPQSLLPAIWLIAILLIPGIAWLFGARQPILENRAKTVLPALNRSSLPHKETFDQIDKFLLDRIPLRGTALDVHGRIIVGVFNESTNPMVKMGSNGWLYYKPELWNCLPEGAPPTADPADSVDILTRTLVASGRRTTVAIAPSKILIHKSDRPTLDERRDQAALRCEEAKELRAQARLKRTPGGVDLQGPLERLESSGTSPYLKSDTHWNWHGRAVWTAILLNGVQEGYANDVALKTRPNDNRPGDLGKLLGVKRTDNDRLIEPVTSAQNAPNPRDYLIIGDSQTGEVLADPTPGAKSIGDAALPGSELCAWTRLSSGRCDDDFRSARSLVVEIVGRDFGTLTAECWRPVALAAEGLRGRPGHWESAGVDSVQPNSLTIPSSGSTTVLVRPAGGDRSSVPRLMRIPINRLRSSGKVELEQPASRNGLKAPCATENSEVEGSALFLPIPAGRRASDFTLKLIAPPGTRLGAPEEIELDGKPLG